MEQTGNQELRVEPGSGASTGDDSGIDHQQTNREPSSDVRKSGETGQDVGNLAGGTAIDSTETSANDLGPTAPYGTDASNLPTGSLTGRNDPGTSDRSDMVPAPQADNSPNTRGAVLDYGEVTRTTDKEKEND